MYKTDNKYSTYRGVIMVSKIDDNSNLSHTKNGTVTIILYLFQSTGEKQFMEDIG